MADQSIRHYRAHTPGTQPEYHSPDYNSSVLRSPRQPLIVLPQTLSELSGPVFGHAGILPTDDDLTVQHRGASGTQWYRKPPST